jgi:hypothetical protein
MSRNPLIGSTKRRFAWLETMTGIVGICVALAGCTVTQTVTLQDVQTTSPIAAPPVRVTYDAQPNQFTITPHLSLPSKKNVTGILEITNEGVHSAQQSDSANFAWTIPGATGGVNIDYVFSRHMSLAFGMSLSSFGNQTYGGWTAGVGIFNEKENGAFRFDFGLQSTPVMYRATSMVITTVNEENPDTVMCFDKGEESYLNFYGALTMNTTRKSWPVNLFFNAFITKQRFIDYTPHSSLTLNEFGSEQVTASHWIAGVTPGLFITMMDDVRLVVGERIIFPFDIVNQAPNPLLQFHMQLDVSI